MRFNVAEGMMTIAATGTPYSFDNYKARTRSVHVNKSLIGMYRGVGMPLACFATELLTDLAAEKLGIDTVEFKRRAYWRHPRCHASRRVATASRRVVP